MASAKSSEDIIRIAKECGFELTDDQLEGISGGVERWCPDCNPFDPDWVKKKD